MSEAEKPSFALPPALVTRADLARLVREVERVDNDLEAQKARSRIDSAAGYRVPAVSRSLEDFLDLNKLELSDDRARIQLREYLKQLKEHAPVLHMTFAAEAEPEFLQQLVAWLRQEIHPDTLLSVGLQPSLVGGAYVRTPNHVHDFSVKSLLQGKRDITVNELDGLRGR